ncbi:hypothetical protein PR202_ga18480 [Eleusine coracana subsp. coracana]|uniref:TF-B3 domain-containing protein n=1 Tax=Eleusine coracana subsp. coracana TaxID=191504 RepID=A0AAV5CRY2_ELECO|nr:hypothetical protein QOZ80_4AG0298350 [Eleusine coracana subsp. coracana]GJN01232.1 hypothetical protein PR202_ga18480 [Eleusine coracana subsp. coracana]
MAALPPPDEEQQEELEEKKEAVVDSDMWLACAVPLSRLPAVGSQVYYFPHGHAEQCPAALPTPLPTPHLFPCTVTAVRLAADDKTNEVYADISLQPGPHRGAAAAVSADQSSISYFAKQLTQSDANNGGGFSVPRYCADFIFPKLDFAADPPVQNLLMRDPRGVQWQFRHIYRGTPRRHLLTTGWSKFVNAKLLVAGDTVVFMRRPDGELLIGLRRAPRYPSILLVQGQGGGGGGHQQQFNARARVPPEDVMDAARLAAKGSPFNVSYYPRLGAGEFVVPRKEVEDALACRWEPGMLVRMQVMEQEDARRTDWATATVKELHPPMWRSLEVHWDDSSPSSSTRSRFVNGWQLQRLVGHPPFLKRFKITDALCSRDDSMAMLLGAPIPPPAAAGIQGARHTHVVPSSSSAMITTQMLFPSPVEDLSGASEILDPEFGSPPTISVNKRNLAAVQTKSIQLFGTTITTPQAQAAASEEVNNEVPDGVLEQDA